MTKLFQDLKSEREIYAIHPFRLHSGASDPAPLPAETKAIKKKSTLAVNFVDRYTSEILVKPSQEKKLAEIAKSHKAKFMKESQYLSQRFSQELEETEKMEQNVIKVTELIGRFAQILSVQSEQVEEMHDSTAVTTTFVKETEAELMVTVQRTETGQQYMSIVIVVLAFVLLFLDFVSP